MFSARNLPPIPLLASDLSKAQVLKHSHKYLIFSYKSSKLPNTCTKSFPFMPYSHVFKFLSKLKVRVNVGYSLCGGGTPEVGINKPNGSDSDSDDIFRSKKAPPTEKINVVNSVLKPPHMFKCRFCQKEYFNDRSKRRHESTCSSSSSAPASKLIVCSACNVGFTHRPTFEKHKKSCDPTSTRYTECVHPKCKVKFYTRLQMAQHLEREHLQDKNREFLEFQDKESFLQWKKEEDMAKFMSTVKHRGCVTTDRVSYEYFCCNFDVRENKKPTKHRVPDFKCPARLLIKQIKNDNKIYVQYIKSHPHDLEVVNLQYHQFRKETLNFVKTNLDNEVNPHKIRRMLVPPDDGVEKFPIKEHFINHRQIRNINQKLQLSVQLHANDAEAVKLLAIKLHKERDSVLVYKPQGEKTIIGDKGLDNLSHSSSLFAFGYQNERMLNELKLAQARILCIDATHNTNKYCFNLLNLIVPDEYGHGYPVAHFICNYLDAATLTSLFSNIHKRCPDLQVVALMTDDDKSTWQAFCTVFGDSTIYLLCHWHIKRAWQKNLSSYIKDDVLRKEVYGVLETILEEKDSSHAAVLLDSFISKYSIIDKCANFVDYFQTHYAKRIKLWAKSHRNFPHAKTDTNMFCESFHSSLKRSGLHRKVNSRLDNLIDVLMKFEYNKYLDLRTLRTFKKPPLGMGDLKCEERHDRGLKIPDSKVSHQISNSKEKWFVQSVSRDQKEHTVILYNQICTLDLCFLKCLHKACEGLCAHLYACSCEDKVPLCKHIHKVHSMVVKNTFKTTNAKADTCTNSCTDEWTMNASPAEKHVPFDIDRLEEKTKTIIGWFHETEADMRRDDVRSNCIPFIYGHMKQIRAIVESVKDQRSSFPPIPTMDYSKIPPNQKEQKQTSLYRTLKKRKAQSPVFKRRTDDERAQIKMDLLDLTADPSDIDEDDLNEKGQADAIIAAYGAKLRKCVIRISNSIHISTLDLKSINLELPYSDLKSCKLALSIFVPGWLTDNVLDAFIHILCSTSSTTLLMETVTVQNVTGSLFNVRDNWFLKTNLKNKSYVFIPSNPDGNHWILFVADLISKKILLLDPLRTIKDLFETNAYGRKLKKESYDFFAQKFRELFQSKLGGTKDDWLVDVPEHYLQRNSSDCGVLVCRYVECLLKGEDLKVYFDTKEYRRYIHRTIVEWGPKEPEVPFDLNFDASL